MKKRTINIITAVLLIGIVLVGLYNIFILKNPGFWKASITQLLTLIVAIIIAFRAAQKKTDERKVKEQIEQIIGKIQAIVSLPDFVTFDVNDNPKEVQKRISLSTRKLSNSVSILQEYSKVINIKDEVNYIEEQVKEYRDFVSVKVGDIDYLSKSESHLKKYAENIDSKCDSILLKLYTEL